MQQGFMGEAPLGYAQLTSIDASTLVSSASFGSGANAAVGIPAGTALLLITPQTQAIRWRDDGGAPTATVGYPLAVGQELRYTARGQSNLRVISQVAGAAINIVAYAGS
jgi:hypothetical protein